MFEIRHQLAVLNIKTQSVTLRNINTLLQTIIVAIVFLKSTHIKFSVGKE